MEQPSITIYTELVDLLTDDELLCVIAHEVGHIKCGHVLHKTMARVATATAAIVSEHTFGLGRLISAGLLTVLEEWDRMSELSSDRAGLLVVQDVEVSIRVLMKLSGGCQAVVNQMDRGEFLKQAELYEALDGSFVNRMYRLMLEQGGTHPFLPLRAREIKDWSESAAYRELLDKHAAAGHIGYYRGKALASEVGAKQARKGYQRGKALPPRDGENPKSEG